MTIDNENNGNNSLRSFVLSGIGGVTGHHSLLSQKGIGTPSDISEYYNFKVKPF